MADGFVFHASGITADTNGIYLSTLDGGAPIRLTSADSLGGLLPSGWLLWGRAGTLVAQRFDLAQAKLTGELVTVAYGVAIGNRGWHAVSVGASGLVAYRSEGGSSQRQLTWFDRSGRARGTASAPDGNALGQPRVSPDGRRVVVSRTVQDNLDLWMLDGSRLSRFTFHAQNDTAPVWSPDGTRIAFRSHQAGVGNLYQKISNGAAAEERLVAQDVLTRPSSWSTDGRFLLYYSNDPRTGYDLGVLPLTGERTPSVFLQTPFDERWGTFSPDGRWVAYMSDESGRHEIYVRPFVPPDTVVTATTVAEGKWQVSTMGGVHPVWRPDGKELYYLNPSGSMMAVSITVKGSTLESAAPVELFPTRILGGGTQAQQGRQYDVAPDGRFLINTVLGDTVAPITLIQNWNPEGKK